MMIFDPGTTARYSDEALLSLKRYVESGAVGPMQKVGQLSGGESQFPYSMSYAITKNASA